MKPIASLRKHQTGAVAIMVGLTIVVLVAFLGMTVDMGRLFITKTELSNAADACSLAAAAELLGDSDSLNRAVSAGTTVGQRNKVNFQGNAVTIFPADITFSDHLNGVYQDKTAAIPANMKYAKCTLPQTGIIPYFMQVMGFGPQTVTSHAVATLSPGITNCAIPVAMCTQPAGTCTDPTTGIVTPTDAMGLCKKQWYCSKFTAGSSSACSGSGTTTGNFNLVNFCTPSDPTCNAPASTLKALLAGSGQCTLATSGPNQTSVKGTGADNTLSTAWNSRFGLYGKGNASYNPTDNQPDFSGYPYYSVNWTPAPQYNAWKGTSTTPNVDNLDTARTNFEPYQDIPGSGFTIGNNYTIADKSTLQTHGANRRLVLMPIVDCSSWTSSNNNTKVPVSGFACVALLNPWDKPGDPIYVEYEGLSSDPGSPCATLGLPGGPGSVGPKVPALVR